MIENNIDNVRPASIKKVGGATDHWLTGMQEAHMSWAY